jgi:pyridoxal phosphate enzyme (YggS family)
MQPADEKRRAELVGALAGVRATIADACAAAGREARSVTLVAVTKTYPATDVYTLAELGVLDIGESKDQEARAKIGDLEASGLEPIALRWHLVGRLQTNKARSVVRYAYAVHSLDRPKLARALADAAEADERTEPLEVFLQVSLDDDPGRGGVPVDELDRLADTVAERPQLVMRGVMAVPPIGADPDRAFARLADISGELRARYPQADAISAGMSADLAIAVRHGATHVRVGTALLGRRSQVLG